MCCVDHVCCLSIIEEKLIVIAVFVDADHVDEILCDRIVFDRQVRHYLSTSPVWIMTSCTQDHMPASTTFASTVHSQNTSDRYRGDEYQREHHRVENA